MRYVAGRRSDPGALKTQRIHKGDEFGSDSESGSESSRTLRTWLVRIGQAFDPMATPDVVLLDDVERCILGRSDGSDGSPAGFVTARDPWMSARHAEIVRREDGFELCDLGSSNGTRHFGVRRSRVRLMDGDIFETGTTFWLFRSMVLGSDPPFSANPGVLGTLSPLLFDVASRLERVAEARVPIMLEGETGTGKEVVAREIHRLSGRTGPFVAINTAAVQANLIASELFGVEKGAHSTAERARSGQIRAAEGGTLLLDEIGDMPLAVQVSLLRVLQESEVLPVGSDVAVKVDVRVVCATHQDLDALVAAGSFRADLYGRLSGCTLELPPLSARVEDIGLLISRFLSRFRAETITFTPAAYRALLVYPWPLNVRELERAIEAAIALSDGRRIELQHLAPEVRGFDPRQEPLRPIASDVSLDDRCKELLRLLAAHRGNVSAVARTMGRSRMQVHRWLKQMNVDPSNFRKNGSASKASN